jgi:hypothetical protein
MLELFAKIAADAYFKLSKGKVYIGGYERGRDWERIEKEIPEINPIYRQTILHHLEVAVHAKKGVFPYKILQTKAPNQSPEEWEYQKGIYEPYTRSAWGRALNRTKIIGNKQNYSITGWDEEQKEYFYSDYPLYHSLESYFFDIVRETKINFPNQLLVIEPLKIPGRYNESNEFIVDQSVLIEPIVHIVEEKDIMAYKENEYSVIVNGKTKFKDKDYPAFKAFDRTTIYKIEVTQENIEGKPVYEVIPYYIHNWGYVPTRKLGGKPSIVNGELFYESSFSEAIPDLNGVIRLSSNLDMSNYSCVFPVRIERVDDCSYKSDMGSICDSGRIWDAKNEGYVTCPSCNGSGKSNRHSPTGVKEVPMQDSMTGQNQIGINDIVTFISPPMEALNSLMQQIKDREEKAFAFIYKTSEKKNTTAEGSNLERDEFRSFILQESNQIFDELEFAIEGIGFMRYMDGFVMPDVSRPVDFSFRDSDEITDEVAKSGESNMPQAYTYTLVKQATKTRFNSSPIAESLIDISLQLDPLWGIDDTIIRGYVGVSISPVDVIIHQRIVQLIEQAEMEYPDFYELETTRQREIIKAYANVIYDSVKPTTDPFNPNNIIGLT